MSRWPRNGRDDHTANEEGSLILAMRPRLQSSVEWLRALPLLAVTAALAILAIFALAGAQSHESRSRERLFDFFARLAPAQYTVGDKFHVVAIDRDSIEAIGPWPWPRTILADLVRAAADAGAVGVILAEPVDSPDPLSPETIGAFWLEGAGDRTFAAELERLPKTDAALAQAFASIDGAVAVSAEAPIDPMRATALQRTDAKGARWMRLAEGEAEFLALPSGRFLYSLDDALAAAAQPAVGAIVADPDGVARRAPLLWSLAGDPAPSAALRAAQLAAGNEPIEVTVDASAASAEGRVPRALSLAGRTIALGPAASLRFSFPRRPEVASTSAASVLDERASGSVLRGKTVIIGRESALGPVVETARGAFSPAEAYAIGGAQMLAGEIPRRPGWTGYLEALAVMALGAGAVMLGQRLDFWRAVAAAVAGAAILTGLAFAIYANFSVLIDPLAPAAALFLGALSVAGGRSIGGVLRDDTYRGSFHDALPEAAMKMVREGEGERLLAGRRREVTVLSCELRMTDEDMVRLESRPEDFARIIAGASLDIRNAILQAGGAADQADGGRLFGYFNAPLNRADHMQAGCACALRLIEGMDRINTDIAQASALRDLQIHLAVGIATGDVFAGAMGRGRTNRYSAVGEAVDRAAYLRSQSEHYGPAMICDERIYKETHHQFAYLELDRVKPRDAERAFSIYALVGNPFIKSSRGYRALDEAHRAFLAAYREGDFEQARERLAAVKKAPGANIALFDIYQDRLDRIARDGASAEWTGVYDHAD